MKRVMDRPCRVAAVNESVRRAEEQLGARVGQAASAGQEELWGSEVLDVFERNNQVELAQRLRQRLGVGPEVLDGYRGGARPSAEPIDELPVVVDRHQAVRPPGRQDLFG